MLVIGVVSGRKKAGDTDSATYLFDCSFVLLACCMMRDSTSKGRPRDFVTTRHVTIGNHLNNTSCFIHEML